MRHTIKQGKHQDNRLFSSWPHLGRKSISRYVTFGESCRYTLPQYNSLDVNKLFGLSFGFFAVHENSARFGWRWNEQDQCIDLLAYCYVNGRRNWNEQMEFPLVAQVKLGQKVRLTIEKCFQWSSGSSLPKYAFLAEDDGLIGCIRVVDTISVPRYGLTHSLYFGGSQPAPHDIHIEIEK
ncbi:hypothetical protein [Hymenobacter metallicola]|uniref:Uncharacterized protein n=1 Tax=Hymenobacter metallicola TaxID=2563114 RepID=A0A4Z0QM14_9BACT|nr:hypothetical protein [Hymenobacter metallicola]TGE29782.1 hypothetical protein E5K02_10070 [Hymenobacter metallicola]